MHDDHRSLREHLRDPGLYGGPGTAGDAWRGALLARFPVHAASRRPVSRAEEMWRLVLLVALPVAGAAALALWAYFRLPAPSLASDPVALRLLGDVTRYLPPGPLLWLALGVASTLITFLVRGRAPRLLPLDW
ncbi:MAG: hypothetical protein H7A46_26890 [Verrucomicrobiales bacterium]|nr:hypothetical protein [Verrucomicrobiales bacterium]